MNAGRLTALHKACIYPTKGQKEIVEMLLAHGADVNAKNVELRTPLMYAACRCRDIVQILLRRGAKPNEINKEGTTAIVFAAKDGNISIVEDLLAAGSEGKALSVALSQAAKNGHWDTVKVLLKAGVSPNITEKPDPTRSPERQFYAAWTPLMRAVEKGDLELVELLLHNGADVNKASAYGISPLMIASRNNRQDLADILIRDGADFTAKDKWGRTASDYH